MVVSTRIMKKPRHSANSAGHGSFSSTGRSLRGGGGLGHDPSQHPTGDNAFRDPRRTRTSWPARRPPTCRRTRRRPTLDAGTAARRRRTPAPRLAGCVGRPGRRRGRRGDGDSVTVYAYARVGYHRSLDLLRRNGWKGHGPVPWEHEPNRGFLTCLALLALAGQGDRRVRRVRAVLGRSCATRARRRTTTAGSRGRRRRLSAVDEPP